MRKLAWVLVLAATLAGCQRLTSLEVDSAELPVCTADDAENWNFANAHMSGVRAEPADLPVGFPAAKKGGNLRPLGGNWYPHDGYRHTLCGVLDHYGSHKAPWISGEDEFDWNLFMLPSSPFAYTITDSAVCPLDGGVGGFGLNCDEWIRCGTRTCIEAEATPPAGFMDNTWFPLGGGESPLVGRGLCVNGPWVGEWLHGLRPEIHPSEMLWWRDREFTYLLMVQDDSSRFDKRSHFENPPAPGTSPWTPWARPPLTGTFHVPFIGIPGRPVGTVSIFNEDAANVVYDDEDITTGRQHGLKVDGELLLRVHELNDDGAIQVGFERLCRSESGSRIFGELTLRSTIGIDTDGQEGFQLVKFAAQWQRPPDDVGPVGPVVDPNQLAVDFDFDAGTVSATTVDTGERVPVVTATVVLARADGGTAVADRIVLRHAAGETTLPFEIVNVRGSEAAKVELPLVQDARLKFFSGEEEIAAVDAPAVGLIAFDEVTGLDRAGDSAAAWTGWVDGEASVAPVGAASVAAVTSKAHILYGMHASGYVHAEDEHPVSAAINAVLSGEEKASAAGLFGVESPVDVEWMLQAVDPRIR